MKLRYRITLRSGTKIVAEAEGRDVDTGSLTVAEATERIIETETFIEKLTGLRCHIEQVR